MSALYQVGCGHDHGPESVEAIDLKPWKELIDKVTRKLFNGSLTPSALDEGLVLKIFSELDKAGRSGFGENWVKFDAENSPNVPKIKENLFRFSAAKTYQELAEMNANLVDENGKIRTFQAFKDEVQKTHQLFNRTHLQAEFQTAKRSAQAARQWEEFQADKDLFPNLIYRTIGDDRVRDEHEPLDGIIKPIDDSFWDTYYPPNGFRCRCTAQPTTKAVNNRSMQGAKVDKGFEMNVGKSAQFFSETDHPYFAIPKGDSKAFKESVDILIKKHRKELILKTKK